MIKFFLVIPYFDVKTNIFFTPRGKEYFFCKKIILSSFYW